MKICRVMFFDFSTVNVKFFKRLPWKSLFLSFLFLSPFLHAEEFVAPDLTHLKERALPPLNVESVAVAGLSSGGYMATQYQIAFANEIIGAGIVASGPFYCAEGSLMRVAHHCMRPSILASPPDLPRQNENLNYFAHLNLIDNPVALKKHKVYVFGSLLDNTVYFKVVSALMDFYREHIPKGQYLFDRHKSAAHAFVSPFALPKNTCENANPPFLNRCGDFDTAHNILNHLYGNLNPLEKNPEQADVGTLYAFPQKEFTSKTPKALSLSQTGYVYIPKDCEKGRCRLVMALHGCKQNVENVGDAFIRQSGFLQWAANNQMVVLFPQTTERSGYLKETHNTVLNPYACWDWWGYTGNNYIAKTAPQLSFLNKMVQRLKEPLP